MNALATAATLAEESGWSLSNLQLNKLLYLAQMFHMGEHNGVPIFDDDFEAWKLGPVVPHVYRQAKLFGDKPVTTFFTDRRLPADSSGREMLRRMLRELTDKSPWKLVRITHWENGAWAKNFAPGEFGCVIPKADILNEYRARAAAKAPAN